MTSASLLPIQARGCNTEPFSPLQWEVTLAPIRSCFLLVLRDCFGEVYVHPLSLRARFTILTNETVGILRQKGVELGSVQFLKQNILPLILTATVALAVVVGEVRIIFPDG